MNYFVGIDIGGTNTKIAIVSEKGVIIHTDKIHTETKIPKEEMLKIIVSSVFGVIKEANLKNAAIKGIGFGVPGNIDYENAYIHTLVNIHGWEDTPLRKLLSQEVDWPIYVDNDVNVMALGELKFGAAKNKQNVLCITLGTGLGGGIIIDGNLYRGSSGTAGEIGHIVFDPNGPACNCGSWGCIETYVGNSYIVEYAVRRLRKKPESLIQKLVHGNLHKVTPKILQEAAHEGDEFACAIWEEVGINLGIVLAGVVNLLNPELIVIGGGVGQAGDLFISTVEKTIIERSMKVPAEAVSVKPAKLGPEAGVIGAAALVMTAL